MQHIDTFADQRAARRDRLAHVVATIESRPPRRPGYGLNGVTWVGMDVQSATLVKARMVLDRDAAPLDVLSDVTDAVLRAFAIDLLDPLFA